MSENGRKPKKLTKLTKAEYNSLQRKVAGKAEIAYGAKAEIEEEKEVNRIAKVMNDTKDWPIIHGKRTSPEELKKYIEWLRKENPEEWPEGFGGRTDEQIIEMITQARPVEPEKPCTAPGCKEGQVFKGKGNYAPCETCKGTGLI